MNPSNQVQLAPAEVRVPSARWRNGRRLLIGLVLTALAIAAYQAFWHDHLKRFNVVRPGVLYRTGQPTELGLRYARIRYKMQTDLNTRRYRKRLRRGLFDPGKPSGDYEADYATRLGMNYVQWPQGDQRCWPWPTPWFHEALFKLFDDPANYPVLVHCMGGRHRTGTVAALFRLEYDRWPVERVLDELYSYSFGDPIPIHDHNLRTYLPRPRPGRPAWRRLLAFFGPLARAPGKSEPGTYEQLVFGLRNHPRPGQVADALEDYLDADEPFAVELAQRLIDAPDHPAASTATRHATRALHQTDVPHSTWSMSAALVADFGTFDEQKQLLDLLASADRDSAPSARYEAIVSGVTNRYTPNRVPYLRPLLDDDRHRPTRAAARYRYCDNGVARLSVIINQNLVEYPGPNGGILWDRGRDDARQWFDEHPAMAALRTLEPPTGREAVQASPETEQLDKDGRPL